MARTYWASAKQRYNSCFEAWYECRGSEFYFKKTCESGPAREQFIKEQNSLIRRFSSDGEYIEFYKSILTLTA